MKADLLNIPVYTYTITNWGNTAELDKLVWSVANNLTIIPNAFSLFSLPRSMLVSHCQNYTCYISQHLSWSHNRLKYYSTLVFTVLRISSARLKSDQQGFTALFVQRYNLHPSSLIITRFLTSSPVASWRYACGGVRFQSLEGPSC